MTAHQGSRGWKIFADGMFVVSCATSSFAFLVLFTRFAKRRSRLFDSLVENACGIYLVHYAFMSWLQLALLKSRLAGFSKEFLVLVGAALLSLGTAALLRRIPLSTISRRVN